MHRVYTSALGRGALFAFGSVIVRSISIITLPYFTRILTQDEYATVALFISSITILSAVIGLGLPSTVANGKVEFQKQFKFYCESIQVTSIFIGIIIASIVGLTLKYNGFLVIKNELIICGVIYAASLTVFNIEMEYLKFANNVRIFLVYSISSAITSSFGSILVIEHFPESDHLMIRILGLVLPVILISFFLTISRLKRLVYDKTFKFLKFGVLLGYPMIFHGLSIILLLQSDRWFLARYASLESVALFSLAASVVSLLTIVSNSISQVFKPWFYTNYNTGRDSVVMDVVKGIMSIVLFVVVILILVAPEIVNIFAPQSYQRSVLIIPILSLGFFAQFMYNLCTYYSNINKANKQIAKGTILALVFNVFFNRVLVQYDIFGVSIATMISFGVLFAIQFRVAGKFHIRSSFPLAFGLKAAFAIVLAGLVMYVGIYSTAARLLGSLLLLVVMTIYFLFYESNSILSSSISSYKGKR